ncbi:hypothetical protein [Microtetraspora sp. NBRC 13810]|uniref:hypothetical protein n=1 Tax=Microtetraspora sp. NBRC 13810 TaxID=3030990 RepID=UPI002552296C|nr:hypothetical protein [Microtetraspora sp. NBRC 13810]
MWRLSRSMFDEIDSFAWTQDWRIERRITRRLYHDRRFDSLVQCSECHGSFVVTEDEECRICSGTGHLILLPMPGGEG